MRAELEGRIRVERLCSWIPMWDYSVSLEQLYTAAGAGACSISLTAVVTGLSEEEVLLSGDG
jgi:hypothetical protein